MPIGPPTDLGSDFRGIKPRVPKTDRPVYISISDVGSLGGGMYQQVAVKKSGFQFCLALLVAVADWIGLDE